MGPNQTYKFCTTKETIKKTRRQTTDWEKIFANDATDKSFISKIQLIPLHNNKKTKKINQKLGRRSKYTFLQIRHTNGQQGHEKMPNISNCWRNANQNYNDSHFCTAETNTIL